MFLALSCCAQSSYVFKTIRNDLVCLVIIWDLPRCGGGKLYAPTRKWACKSRAVVKHWPPIVHMVSAIGRRNAIQLWTW